MQRKKRLLHKIGVHYMFLPFGPKLRLELHFNPLQLGYGQWVNWPMALMWLCIKTRAPWSHKLNVCGGNSSSKSLDHFSSHGDLGIPCFRKPPNGSSRCWSPTYTRSWVLICFDPFSSLSDDIGQIHNNTVQKHYRITATKWIQMGYKIPPAQLHPNKGHNWPYIYIYIINDVQYVYNVYSLFIMHVGFHKTIESPFHILPGWPPSSSEPTGLFVFPLEISDGSISGRHLAHSCGF